MSHLRWYARRSLDTLRYEGVPILLWRVLSRCLVPFGTLQPWTFYEHDLGRPIPAVRTAADVRIMQATESDVQELATLVARRYGPTPIGPYARLGIRATIVHRLRRGLRCFVARTATGEIVHYNWIAVGREETLGPVGASILLRDGEAYCSDAYTVETWRGRSIHTTVLRAMLVWLHQAGYRKAYTDVGTDNKSSWKAHERLGWTMCGLAVDFIPRGGRRIWRIRLGGGANPFFAVADRLMSLPIPSDTEQAQDTSSRG